MSLDVSHPEPPDLDTNAVASEYEDASVGEAADYRREELETYLRDGAWEEAWNQWRVDTELTGEEYEIVDDLGLLSGFDFFWDDFANRVGYHAPGIPEDWKERELHSDLESWENVSSINAALTELGQVVSDVLKNEYVSWESEFEAPDDLPDFDEE